VGTGFPSRQTRNAFARRSCSNQRASRVEPFSFLPDKTLPGTLHHSGNRPAPPSDHTPLARRSAFQRGRRGNSDAPAGLERTQSRISAVPTRGKSIGRRMEYGTLRFHSRYAEDAGDFMNHKGVEYTLTKVGNSEVGKDRGTACPAGHAPCPVKKRSRAEARGARQLTS